MALLTNLSLLILLAGPPGLQSPEDGAIVMRIDGEEIRREPFVDWLVATRSEVMMRSFVDYWLIKREMRRIGVDDVAAEAREMVEAEIAMRVDRAYGGDASKWLDELKRSQRTPHGRRAERQIQLEIQFMLRDIAAAGRTVPPEKIEREWHRIYGQNGRSFDVRVIYKRFLSPTDAEERERARAAVKAGAVALRERAEAGESFADLARQHSEDPLSRDSGGAPPGGFQTVGWPAETLDEIAALSPGEISGPYFLKGGFWLVQLEQLVVTPLADVEAELRAMLMQRGPEGDEMSALSARLWVGVEYEALPALYELGTADAPLSALTPVVRIAGVDVSRGELTAWLVPFHADVSVHRFAEEHFLSHTAEQAGVQLSAEEIDLRVEQDLARMIEVYYQGDAERWKRETLGSRGTLEVWRRDTVHATRVSLKVERLFEQRRVISDAMLEAAWVERYGPGGVSIGLRMIRVDPEIPEFPPETSPEEIERMANEAIQTAHDQAHEVARRAQEGEDFATLARSFSTDEASRASGGELAPNFDHRVLPQAAVSAIESCAAGEVTDAITVGVSSMVFEVLGRREVPFEQVREALHAELMTRRPTVVEIASLRNQLTRGLQIEVLEELFR